MILIQVLIVIALLIILNFISALITIRYIKNSLSIPERGFTGATGMKGDKGDPGRRGPKGNDGVIKIQLDESMLSMEDLEKLINDNKPKNK